MKYPRIDDDDEGIITITFCEREVRVWCYNNEEQQRSRMKLAHEYVEGWYNATGCPRCRRHADQLHYVPELDHYLCIPCKERVAQPKDTETCGERKPSF